MGFRLRKVLAPALLALLLAAPAAAQPSARGAAELEALEHAVRAEAITRVVDSIADRLARTDPAKAERVRAKRIPSATFVRNHLGTDSAAMLEDLFSRELSSGRLAKADLKFDMELFRAFERGYTLRPVEAERMPEVASGFEPPRSRGYPPEVAAIDNAAPHSMHDLHDYMADRFTRAALDRAVREGYVVELHAGGEREALSDLKNRGWQVIGEVKSGGGAYERLFVAEGPGGEIRYVISGTVDGMDRVRHLSSLLRFAGPEGRGIPADKIEIVGDVEALKERDYRAMRDGLANMGLPGDAAMIGFRGTLKNELLERALARRGAEHLRDVLGSDPREGLLDALRAERDAATGSRKADLGELIEKVEASSKLAGLDRAPQSVFSRVTDLKALIAAERELVSLADKHSSSTLDRLVADGKLRLPGGASAADYTVGRALEFGPLRADEVRVRTADGKVTGLRLVNNYYGDAMSGVVRALLETGHTNIAYFGTAGGLAEGARVGDIHVPERVYDFRGDLASGGVDNALLEHLEGRETALGERLRTGTALGNVFSPAEETMRWLEETRARGVDAVEVENSYITREVARHNAEVGAAERARLMTSVIISDVPGSHQTLGSNNGATTATFEKMVDHYLEALGVSDIELVSKEDAKVSDRPLARDDRARLALEVADKLVPRSLAKSNMLRDRIAEIVGTLDVATLEGIDTSNKLKPRDIPGLSPEERARLEAEVKHATTDAQLLESLGRGDAALSQLSRELARRHPGVEFELRVAGGVERGAYSPATGLKVEVVGSEAVRASAAELLPELRGGVSGAPAIELVGAGGAGERAIALDRAAFRGTPQPLVDAFVSRALIHQGAIHRGASVIYGGRAHDRMASDAELFSRYETYEVGPSARERELRRFEERVRRLNGRVEYVPSSDPRLRGGQGRTLLATDGSTLVLLPSDREVRRYALLDELTHTHQLDRMRRELGVEKVRELFRNAQAGDPAALARLVEWEIKAKRMVRLTLPAEHPDRALLDREIERLHKVLDPYLEARRPNGTLDWERVRGMARQHAEGAASFLLGLFLKDLARVIQSGDRAVIEAFFDGLATTEFWSHYGLFVVGAEVGSAAYTRYLQRFVRPAFVSNVLKSNVALATGMALPELVRGRFDGRTYAVNLTGFMLSSAAVKAGLSTIRWVAEIGNISRYQRVSRALKLARGVPGWIYAGVETAVILYFGESISHGINRFLERRAMRRDVARAAERVLDAAAAAGGADDAALLAALDEAGLAYTRWRDRSLAPALDATTRLNAALNQAGRRATIDGTGNDRAAALEDRYPHLREARERLAREKEAEVDAMVSEALERFERDRRAALEAAYTDGRRGSAYRPEHDPGAVSDNRPEAYEDEARLYEAAARRAREAGVRDHLLEWARITREIAARERALFFPEAGAPAAGESVEHVPARGALGALEEAVR